MENNWPETIDELMEECQMLVSKTDLYELGERGEPFTGESEPRVDGTDYLAGEYQYGVAMIPAQWVTNVLFRYWQMGWLDQLRDADTRWHELFGTPKRAANTVLALQVCPMSKDECEECPAYDVCFEYYKDGRTVYEMAEWLRGDAE